MKRIKLLLLFSLLMQGVFAQINVLPDGKVKMPNKAIESTLANADSVLVGKSDGVIGAMDFLTFKSLISLETSGLQLPVHELDTLYASGDTTTAYITDARFENKLNGAFPIAGTRRVFLANDASYNHDIGTILWFQGSGEGTIEIYYEDFPGTQIDYIVSGAYAYLKKDSNSWSRLLSPGSADASLADILSNSADAGGTTITNVGPPSLSTDAARKIEIDNLDVNTDGINQSTDFTIADSDIGEIHNIITDDSIVVTYPPDLTVFGFTKFVVDGDGFVAVDLDSLTTTNGNWKSQTGRGEGLTVRNYSATKGDVMLPSQLLTYVPTTDAYSDPSLVAKFSADNLTEGDEVDVANFSDDSSTYTFEAIDANQPNVNVRVDARKELVFTSSVGESMDLASDFGALDFDMDADEYTIVIAFGNGEPQFSQAVLTKGEFGSSTYQFGISTFTTGDNLSLTIGGSSNTVSGGRTSVANSVWVIRRDTNGVDLLINDVEVLTDLTPGTLQATQTWQLAGRGNIVNQAADVSFKTVAFYSSHLSNAKLTTIYTQEQ